MAHLRVVEETDDRLVLRMGAFAMFCHMTLCTVVTAAVTASLTVFLRHYLGIFAFIFVATPGVILVICGLLGMANARQFTFTFDRGLGTFTAAAGGAQLVKHLSEVQLVHVERESSSGGLFGAEAPCFAAAVLFSDGRRCRLEGGVSATGSGRGPDDLQVAAQKIRDFCGLPQLNVPLLLVSRATKDERAVDVAQAEAGLSRWLACQGIAPRLEPPLLRYEWAEPPEGPVRLPNHPGTAVAALLLAAAAVTRGGEGGLGLTTGQRWARAIGPAADPGLGPVVVGRPAQPPPAQQQRMLQIVVPLGGAGQTITAVAPDGTQLSINVPADAQEGEPLSIRY